MGIYKAGVISTWGEIRRYKQMDIGNWKVRRISEKKNRYYSITFFFKSSSNGSNTVDFYPIDFKLCTS